MKIACTSILSILLFTMAGQRVKSSSYDLLLQGLLSHTVKEVSVEDLQSMSDVQFVDSREADEYRVSHIIGATFVGYDKFDLSALKDMDKNKAVVVYCSVGYRSEKIAEKLQKAGFTKVYNLYGGIFEWVNQDKPVYNSAGPTNNIHPYSWLWGQWLSKGNKTSK